MCVPPTKPYFKYTCPACGWSVVIKQRSDAIIAPRSCQQCGNGSLEVTRTSSLMGVLADLWRF